MPPWLSLTRVLAGELEEDLASIPLGGLLELRLTLEEQVLTPVPLKILFQAFQGRTTPFLPLFLRPRSPAMARWTAGTTATLRLSARRSTSAPTTATLVSPSSRSSVPTAPCSSNSTSSATGGSTWTAPPPRTSTA